MQKTMRFEFNISNVEKINPLFSKAIVRIAYHGINRNNSYISKETFNKAIPTLFNIPVVGEYLENKDNFGGHGGKLEISDKGIKWIQTTKPYGVVGENAKVYWEEVTEKDGSIHEYLTVDGVYLWTGRYEELNNLLEKNYGQSMEIEIQNGNFAIIDGQEVFKIDDFVFSALCILGVDKGDNPDDHVEPCFESSSIMVYSLNKEEFTKQFKQMLEELRFSLNSSNKGGQVVKDKKDLQTDNKTDFTLTNNQLRDEIRAELYKEYTIDAWGFKNYKYWYVDHTDNLVIAEDTENGYRLVGFNYTVENDKVSIDFESKKRVRIMYEPIENSENNSDDTQRLEFNITSKDKVEYESKVKEKEMEQNFASQKDEEINKVQKEFTSLKEKCNQLEQEVNELRQFKANKLAEERAKAEQELYERFSAELTEEEIAEVKAVASEYTLEQLEEKLFTLVGKKKANFSKQAKKEKQSIKIDLEIETKEKTSKYGDLFERFGK